jgi:hypothetical protein
MLQHVLGDEQIDGVVGEGQPFDVLAADAVTDRTKRHIGEELGSGITPAFL